MALEEKELSLLRKAICSGAFSTPQNPLTEGVLAEIGKKSEEEVRAILTVYKKNLQRTLEERIKIMQGQIDELNA